MGRPRKGPGAKQKSIEYTTQRVDANTLFNIKRINYHLLRNHGIKISQSRVIEYAVLFALSQEAEFLDFVDSGSIPSKDSAFDTVVKITGKPWFPYGNLIGLD